MPDAIPTGCLARHQEVSSRMHTSLARLRMHTVDGWLLGKYLEDTLLLYV